MPWLDFWSHFPSLWFVLLCFFCLLFDSQLVRATLVKQQEATDFALLQGLCFLSPKSQSNLQTCYLLDSPACRRGGDKAPLCLEKERQEEVELSTELVCIGWGNVSMLNVFSPLYLESAL